MRNYLFINGADSRDFGVFISGQGTFNAPEKAYDFYTIPGRNGALIGNEKRLENVELTYQAFICENFEENVANLRAFLLGLNGYQMLTDSYHPDEYRMAAFVGPLEIDVSDTNDSGEFTLRFNCKPQRYLFTGYANYHFIPEGGQEVSGESVNAYQTLLDTSVMRVRIDCANVCGAPPSPAELTGYTEKWLSVDNEESYSFTLSNGDRVSAGDYDLITGEGTVERLILPLLEIGWEYDNGLFVLPFPEISGILACSHYPLTEISYDGENVRIRDSRFSDADSFMAWLSGETVEIDAVCAEPIEVSFEPYYIDFPPEDYVLLSVGEDTVLTVKYQECDYVENPTEFDAQPIIYVYGTGTFTINDIDITVNACEDCVTIDCELMDCYEWDINRNNDVTFSTYDFPVLVPGETRVEFGEGNIRAIQLVPRWWRV